MKKEARDKNECQDAKCKTDGEADSKETTTKNGAKKNKIPTPPPTMVGYLIQFLRFLDPII